MLKGFLQDSLIFLPTITAPSAVQVKCWIYPVVSCGHGDRFNKQGSVNLRQTPLPGEKPLE